MHPILEYFVKANGLLLFFWLFYRLFLHKETFYTTNRWYLLGSIVASLIAPFITFTKTVFIEAPKPTIDWDQLAAIKSQNTIVKENLFTIENFAIVIIGLISTILVLKTLFQLAQTYHKIKQLPYDASLQVRRSSEENIFSLYPYIVVPNHFEENPNSEMILTHEKVHIQQKHSFDMILMQLIRSVFWMNPLLRYLQIDIEVNLEYIVDEHLQKQFDSKTYQLSLLSFNTATPQPFVNSFNSQLKKRILKINSKKSNPMKKLKMILAAPAIVAFFTLFQIETQAQVIEKTETISKQSNDSVLFFIDGNKVTEDDVRNLSPDSIGSVNVINNQETLKEHGNTSTSGSIYITTKNDDSKITSHTFSGNYIYMVDGKVVTADEFTKASQKTNKEINIVQNSNYAKELGYDGKDGVFILTTKVESAPVKIIEEVKYNGKTISMDELIASDLNTQENKTFEFKFKKKEDTKNILYIVNGKEISETDFRKVEPDDIESVTVLKDKNATEKYGAKGKDGVIEIQLKEKKS